MDYCTIILWKIEHICSMISNINSIKYIYYGKNKKITAKRSIDKAKNP